MTRVCRACIVSRTCDPRLRRPVVQDAQKQAHIRGFPRANRLYLAVIGWTARTRAECEYGPESMNVRRFSATRR
jgi:hypothetical protein